MASAGAAQNCARCLGSSPRRGVVWLCLQTWAHGGAVRWGTGSQARGRPLLLRHKYAWGRGPCCLGSDGRLPFVLLSGRGVGRGPD